MGIKFQAVHLVKPGSIKTPNGMIDTYCRNLNAYANLTTVIKEDATCKRCLAEAKVIAWKHRGTNGIR